MNSKNFLGGAVIVLIGVIFLGINLGWWTHDVWSNLWRLWPVLLIVAGLRQVVRREGLFMILALFVVASSYVLVSNSRLTLPARLLTLPTPPTSSLELTVSPSPLVSPPTIKEKLGEVLGLTKPEENKMNEFKSEIQVGDLDALAIQLSRNYDITLTGTDNNVVSVELKGPQKILDDLSLAPDGSRLVLKDVVKSGIAIFTDNEKVTGTIRLPKTLHLDLKLSGVTKLKLDNMAASLAADNSGASSVEYVNSTTHNPVIKLSGTARIDLDKCDVAANLDLSGVATVSAQSCQLNPATIKADGSAGVEIKSGSITDLKADASGVAKIRVPKPSGKIEATNSGASSINYY